MKILIVTGGNVQESFARTYQMEEGFDYTIAVDSGIRYFYHQDMEPDLMIGDFDSADPKMYQYFQIKGVAEEQFLPEKDATDTELAIEKALAMDVDEIHILGATGSRIDHVLGSIRVLGLALEKNVPCFLVDQNNRIRLVKGKNVLKKKEQYGTYVSILPFTTSLKGLTLKGFKYPLDDAVMEGYHALGVSNEIEEDEAVISIKEGVAIVVESSDQM
ncbi:MAG: thiamine diphosphokinase [Lachnospiraceae bacterium]